MGFDSARTRNRHLEALGLDRPGVDVARASNIVIGRLRGSGPGLDAARAGDRQLELLDVDRSEVDSAGAGDRPLEARARDLVDRDVARAGDTCAAQLWNGDDEMRLAMVSPAPVEEAMIVFRADDELVAGHFDHSALEQPLAAPRRHRGVGAGADLDVVGTGDLDRREVADAVVLRRRRSAAFLGVDLAAGESGSGDDRREGPQHAFLL